MRTKCTRSGLYVLCVSLLLSCGDPKPGVECGEGTVDDGNGQCKPANFACESGTVYDPGSETCVVECGPGTTLQVDECLPDGSVICQTGTTFQDGTCVPDITGCGVGTVLVAGQCVGEDDAIASDVNEPAEPNDPAVLGGVLPTFPLPVVGESVVIHGCSDPQDRNGDGVLDNDVDVFAFDTDGPTYLEITVDGVGGMAGGFIMGGEELPEILRAGINLTSDMSQRELLIPSADTINIAFLDGRYAYNILRAQPDEPLDVLDESYAPYNQVYGGPGACYYATIRRLALPVTGTAVAAGSSTDGTYEHAVLWYQYTPAEGDSFSGDSVVTTHQQFAASAATSLHRSARVDSETSFLDGNLNEDFSPEVNMPITMSAGDAVLVAVDHQVNLRVDGADFTLELSDKRKTSALPTDGSTVASTKNANTHYFYLDGNAGDLFKVGIEVQDGGASPLEVNGLQLVSFDGVDDWLCSSCDEDHDFIYFPSAGRYYVEVDVGNLSNNADYVIKATATAETIGTLDETTDLTDEPFSDDGIRFYRLAADEWYEITGDGDGAVGGFDFIYYADDRRGAVRDPVRSTNWAALGMFAHLGPAYVDNTDGGVNHLIRARDTDAPVDGSGTGYTSTFDLSIDLRPYTFLGTFPAFGGLFSLQDESLAASSTTYYVVRTYDFDNLDLAIIASNLTGGSTSLDITVRDRNGFSSLGSTAGGPGENVVHITDTDTATDGDQFGYILFEIESDDGGPTDYDLSVQTSGFNP